MATSTNMHDGNNFIIALAAWLGGKVAAVFSVVLGAVFVQENAWVISLIVTVILFAIGKGIDIWLRLRERK